MRRGVMRRHPELRDPPPRQPPAKRVCPRRICIPIEDHADLEGFNALHDLDRASGGNEMNALLSLVLSMGQNRVAGALRFDSLDSPSDDDSPSDSSSSSDEAEADGEGNGGDDGGGGGDGGDNGGEGGGGGGGGGGGERPRPAAPPTDGPPEIWRPIPARSCRGVLTFELRDARSPPPEAAAEAGAEAKAEAGPSQSPDMDASERRTDTDLPKDDSTQSKDTDEAQGVPSEVEIYLGKLNAPSTSGGDMEWEAEADVEEEAEAEGEARRSASDEDSAVGTASGDSLDKERKRQKLDSGVGEENTASSGSSPGDAGVAAPGATDARADTRRTRRTTEALRNAGVQSTGRRRVQKRSRCPMGNWSVLSPNDEESESDEEGGSAPAPAEGAGDECRAGRRRTRDGRAAGTGGDARRVRLSLLMKRAVKELPLPHALKKFVNLGRCFEF